MDTTLLEEFYMKRGLEDMEREIEYYKRCMEELSEGEEKIYIAFDSSMICKE